jgi:uncharacterized protein YceK
VEKKRFTVLTSLCLVLILAAILISGCTAQPATTQPTTTGQPTTSAPTTQPTTAKDKIIIGMPSELTGPLANVRA